MSVIRQSIVLRAESEFGETPHARHVRNSRIPEYRPPYFEPPDYRGGGHNSSFPEFIQVRFLEFRNP